MNQDELAKSILDLISKAGGLDEFEKINNALQIVRKEVETSLLNLIDNAKKDIEYRSKQLTQYREQK